MNEQSDLPAILALCVEGGLIEASRASEVAKTAPKGRRELVTYLIERSIVDPSRLAAVVADASTADALFARISRRPPGPLTFDTLVEFRGNEFAVEAGRHVAGGLRPGYNPMYVYSPVGMGKTHILGAIGNLSLAHGTTRGVLYANLSDFEVEVERAYALGKRAMFRDLVADCDLVLLDDLQHCEGRDSLQLELVSLLNDAFQRGTRVVLTSDVMPMELRGVEERLISRFGGGVIAGLQPPDRDDRLRILERADWATGLARDTLSFLADTVTANIRGLRGAAQQLLAMKEVLGMSPTADLARAVIPSGSPRERVAAAFVPVSHDVVGMLRRIMESAENEDEYAMALQIAVATRLRHLREVGGEPDDVGRLEKALGLLRSGEISAAVELIAGGALGLREGEGNDR